VSRRAHPRRPAEARVAVSSRRAMHDWPALVRARLTDLTVDPARAADIVDELAQHVAQHHAELVASGVGAPEALRRALAPLDDPARLSREIARADRPRRAAPVP